jgi:hypothetical protein
MRQLVLLLTCSLCIAPAHAVGTLYVATDGTGTACTRDDPCGNIQQAVNLAAAGDRVVVHPGTYVENVTIPAGKEGLTLTGDGDGAAVLQSAGGDLVPKFAPAGVPADIVLDIFAADVAVRRLTIRHPEGSPTKRDIGVFVRPSAPNVQLAKLDVERARTGPALEPIAPGSRGLLVIRATGTEIHNSTFTGNYQDHLHLPTSQAHVLDNVVRDATRLGIVIIQETPVTLSTENIIRGNRVTGSGSDGIQIQGDDNIVQANHIAGNGGYGILLCGPGAAPACVPPGSTADASGNVVLGNRVRDNALGAVADFGSDNIVRPRR